MDVDRGTSIIRHTVRQTMSTIGRDPTAPPVFAEHAQAVGALLNDMMTSVVTGDTWPGPLVLVSLCRTLDIDRAGLDLLAHHTLTALLAQQPGPEALVRTGATFAAATCHLPGADASNPNPHRAGSARAAAARSGSHLPMPPTWACSGCAQEWPCASKQSQLLTEFGGTGPALGIYLGSCFSAALFDLPRADRQDLRTRFLGWLPRENLQGTDRHR
ncbi:hypothetical protein [Micromonospora sp. NPDC049799]|uniref:hypothetical protein n=1 Tax=Micromonospora sp. NPDC049799 TaxID=3154741 RepID=UPI0033FFBB11